MPNDVFVHGTCQCGAVRFEVLEKPLGPWVCHCLQCRKVSAGPMTMTVAVRRAAFRVVAGDFSVWERISDLGTVNRAHFCPTCGNRIYHDNPADLDVLRVKTGAFAGAALGEPLAHLWARHAANWIHFTPDTLVYDAQPPLGEFFAAIEKKQAGG